MAEDIKNVQQEVTVAEAIDNEKSVDTLVPANVPLEEPTAVNKNEGVPENYTLPIKLDKVEEQIKEVFKYLNMFRSYIMSPVEMAKEINNRRDNVFYKKLSNIIAGMSSEVSKEKAVDIFRNDIKRQVEKRIRHLDKSYFDLEELFINISEPLKDTIGTIIKTSNADAIKDRGSRLKENELTINFALKRLEGSLPIPLVNGVERFTPFSFLNMIREFLNNIVTSIDTRSLEESYLFYKNQIFYFKDAVKYQEHIKSLTTGDEKKSLIEDYSELNIESFLKELISKTLPVNGSTDKAEHDSEALDIFIELTSNIHDYKNKLIDNTEKLLDTISEYCEIESPFEEYLEALEEKAFKPLVENKITTEEFDTVKGIYSVAINNIYLADREFLVAINNACISQYLKLNMYLIIESILDKTVLDITLIKGRSTVDPKLDKKDS